MEKTGNYHIYFDESQKIDSPEDIEYSFYGAFGVSISEKDEIEKDIKKIFKELNTESELHFNQYKPGDLRKYFRVFNYLLSRDIAVNIFMLNNNNYKELGSVLGLNIDTLKKHFYVKIPERLFYGIVRYQKNISNISVFMDQSTEYKTLKVYEKIKEQMNSHSLYRRKEYQVLNVKGMASENSTIIQSVDIIMGMIVFILDKKYLGTSKATDAKSDLIYRVLLENNNLEKVKKIITIFIWNSNTKNEDIEEYLISDSLNDFLLHMNKKDLKDSQIVQEAYINVIKDEKLDPKEKSKKIKDYINCSSGELYKYMGYLAGIEYNDRNKYIR